MSSRRLPQLEYIRAAAMLGVVLIHVTSTFIYSPSAFTVGGYNLAMLANQLVTFSVPLFVLLSGAALGFSRQEGGYFSFLRARLPRLLLPYLLWSVFYWSFNLRWEGGIVNLLRCLLTGGASSQLYFIPIILQLYLLYPLLRKWCQKSPVVFLLSMFAVNYAAQRAIFYAAAGVAPIQPAFLAPYLWELFPSWTYYFGLGIFLHHMGLEKLARWAGRHVAALLTVTTLAAAVTIWESLATNHLDTFKPQLFFYVPLVFFTLLAIGQRLKDTRATPAAAFLAKHSLTVYYIHTFFLTFLRRVPFFTSGMGGMGVMLLCEAVLSVAAAWLLDAGVSLLAKGLSRLRHKT